MKITTSLADIASYSARHSEENEAFLSFLKNEDSTALNELVIQLNDEIEPQIDCTTCGNCCRTLMINVEDEAVERLSALLGQSNEDFRSQYIVSGISRQLFNAIPCPFLKNCKCTVYTGRPSGCREFPALGIPGFTSRLASTFRHYDSCPIVFNVFEALKISTKFHRPVIVL